MIRSISKDILRAATMALAISAAMGATSALAADKITIEQVKPVQQVQIIDPPSNNP